jgi:hypothetical protein
VEFGPEVLEHLTIERINAEYVSSLLMPAAKPKTEFANVMSKINVTGSDRAGTAQISAPFTLPA